MRYAARTDGNKSAIVEALLAAGATVYDLKMPVDLLIGYRKRTGLMEIKDGSKPPSQRKHTPAQKRFLETWTGGPVFTVTDVEGALRALRLLT